MSAWAVEPGLVVRIRLVGTRRWTGPMIGTGRFISFEGIDGSGKSTQVRRLAAHLRRHGSSVTMSREPGGTAGAEAIRSLVVEGQGDRWSPDTECLLFTAARRDHVERVIAPALRRGEWVICDRFVDSTRVYQGIVRSGLRTKVDALHELMIGIEPDLTLILDLDPDDADTRRHARGGSEHRFEDFGLDFQRRLRTAFLRLADEFPDRCRVVPGAGSPELVASRVAGILAQEPA